MSDKKKVEDDDKEEEIIQTATYCSHRSERGKSAYEYATLRVAFSSLIAGENEVSRKKERKRKKSNPH